MVGRGIDTCLGLFLWRPFTILVMIVMDALVLLLGLTLASYLVDGVGGVSEVVRSSSMLLAVWLVVFLAWDLYVRPLSRRSVGALLGAVLSGMGLLAIGSTVYPQTGLSLEEVVLGTAFILISEVLLRIFYERGRRLVSGRGVGVIPTLIVGQDEERARVRQAMEKDRGAYACVGELSTSGGAVDLPLLRQLLDRTGARGVFMIGPERLSDAQFPHLMRSMRLRKVQLKIVSVTNCMVSSKQLTLHEHMGFPVLEAGFPRLDKTQRLAKRMLDVTGSLGGLLILSPLLAATAVSVRLTSPGPAFFRQKRVGADGKAFTCYKFRSMYEDAEQRQAELEALNEADGAVFKMRDDPRVTPIGRFLRRWSIDELPQLVNVLKGEMSLVGPRPLPVRDFECMGGLHNERFGAVPGMTGYWQISGRSDVSFEKMVQLDAYYVENWSLSLDVGILLRTLAVVLRRNGAY